MDKNSSSEYNTDCNRSSSSLSIMATCNVISVCNKVRLQRSGMMRGDVHNNILQTISYLPVAETICIAKNSPSILKSHESRKYKY